jgi:capsular polysaccharide biosynthesis protein
MELRAYLAILWRRRWIAVILPALVLAGVIVQALQSRPSYTATARLMVTRLPREVPPEVFRYDEYYLYLTNEYTVDDFTEVVRGNVFAADVARAVAETTGLQLSAGDVQGALSVERRNRALTIRASSTDPQRAVEIARAAAQTLEARGTAYFGFDDPSRRAIIVVIEQPLGAVSDLRRQQLWWLLQLAVALIGGVLVAFLVDYLADTLDSAEAVQDALGLPVLGVIPVRRR